MLILECDLSECDTRGSVHETEYDIKHTDTLTLMRLRAVVYLTSVSYGVIQTSYIKQHPAIGKGVFQCVGWWIITIIYEQICVSLLNTNPYSLLYMHHKKVLPRNELLRPGEVMMAFCSGIGIHLVIMITPIATLELGVGGILVIK